MQLLSVVVLLGCQQLGVFATAMCSFLRAVTVSADGCVPNGAEPTGSTGAGTSSEEKVLSPTKLLKEVGVDALNLQGSFAALAYKGKVLNDGNVNFYPFRLPISWSARWEIVKAGIKVMRAVNAYGKVNKPRKGEDYRVRQQRIYDFMADKTFSEFTGPLSEEADAFFRPTVSRSSGDPEEISAGAGVGYFLLVWDKSSGLARNIVGGAATLPQAIAHTLRGQGEARSPRCLRSYSTATMWK